MHSHDIKLKCVKFKYLLAVNTRTHKCNFGFLVINDQKIYIMCKRTNISLLDIHTIRMSDTGRKKGQAKNSL